MIIMQASPSGMAAASQAASGEFDSRRLLQKEESAQHSPLFGISDENKKASLDKHES